MRKSWFIAALGAALLALAPASALAHSHRHHHAKRHHRVRTHLRHFTAASSSAGTTGTSTGSGSTTNTPASDNAGTVTSFDGSTLVITLNDGSKVSGAVTGNTELQCEAAQSSSSTGTQSPSDSVQSDFSRDSGGDQPSGSSSGSDQSGSSDASGSDDQNDQGNQADQGEDAGQPATCTSANLTPGTVVHEAELAVSSAGSVWRQVDLVLS